MLYFKTQKACRRTSSRTYLGVDSMRLLPDNGFVKPEAVAFLTRFAGDFWVKDP
jgi:hypothetical protein